MIKLKYLPPGTEQAFHCQPDDPPFTHPIITWDLYTHYGVLQPLSHIQTYTP